MLKKLFSMKVALIVMLIFAISIGVATFIENDYGTQTAQALIYKAKWFEALLFYFTLLVIYNIFAYKMYKRPKWGQLTLHISFILVALGAFLTRYIGYEGILHFREGETKAQMLSDYSALNVLAQIGDKKYEFSAPLYLSSMSKNDFHKILGVEDKKIDFKLLDYKPSVKEGFVKAKDGDDYIEVMVASGNQRGEVKILKKKDKLNIGFSSVGFENNSSLINIYEKDNKLYFKNDSKITITSMDTKEQKTLNPSEHELKKRVLYNFGPVSLVLKDFKKGVKKDFISSSLKSDGVNPDLIKLKVSSANETKIVTLLGKKGAISQPTLIELNGMKLYLSYGAKVINLPFALKLRDFVIDRYPGSNSPSSYSSKVTVIDKDKKFNYHIYMNHVLDYKGYRFFQSSYDMDEKGSILSVNHDPGTLPTYLGYFLMAIGFIWSFLSKKGRVAQLIKKLNKLKNAAAIFVLAILFLNPSVVNAAKIDTTTVTKEELKKIKSINLNHSEKFARLIVQDFGGRMEPLDTLALEVLEKISAKRGFLGLNYNQIFIGMLIEPEIYQKLRFIKISHPLLAKKLGLSKSASYASLSDFLTSKKSLEIQKDIDKAKQKRPANRSKYENELIKVDERLNVLYMVQQGYLLKLFPKPNDPNNTWYNPIDAMKAFPKKEGEIVRYLVGSYFKSAQEGIKSGDWKKANEALDVIKKFQNFYGAKLIPPKQKVEAEIFYNRIDIFAKLILAYLLIGFVLLFTAFAAIVKPSVNLKLVTKIATALLVVTLIIHTAGLILRWYIANHAPWSNAYESILYIAWSTALAGFVFAKKSPISFAATSILTGIFLFVAFISNMNPQITNLMPVLKSYWLMIHVAVITASYGFLGLGALLGMFNLILMIVNKNNKPHITNAIKELTVINEITLLLGLALLTVGNFLGGVWANESWGRYWGWDPKETWAAVTILVYATVVHMRFIPKLNSVYAFNVAAILAYFSVIMTYFGVNYYLSGMHSYAAGDPVPIPTWVYFAVALVFILIFGAYKYRLKARL
jgi:cytochrome c-type biogenesis protein CcsB